LAVLAAGGLLDLLDADGGQTPILLSVPPHLLRAMLTQELDYRDEILALRPPLFLGHETVKSSSPSMAR
jgi:hypothetical protein